MEILSRILKQILVFRDTDTLLDDLLSGEKSSADILRSYTLQDYLQGVASDDYGTLDQQTVGFDMMVDGNHNDVFRQLLSFCDKKLIVSSGEPVCRYRYILQWNELTRFLGEDIFITAFLASNDLKSGIQRNHFQWPAYVHHDNQALNQIMKKEFSELHAHLKGSTLNFELSWLSLMNNICNRRKSFRELNDKLVHSNHILHSRKNRELYMLVTIAAFIRLLFFKKLRNIPTDLKSDTLLLRQLLWITNSDCAVTERRTLQASIEVIRHQYGQHYSYNSIDEVPDYAIPPNQKGLLTVLTGERWLMYSMFLHVYDKGIHQYYYKLLFYIYLHVKSVFRNKLIQTNPMIGFHNFSIFERRKDLFIPDNSLYERLSTLLAFGSFLEDNPSKRYMEGRVVPKENSSKIIEGLWKMQSALKQNAYGVDTDTWRNSYIYHFIKRKDNCKNPDIPRHHALRKDVEHQSKAILNAYCAKSDYSRLIVGVDAANSENYARPEVFAQAFRYLRQQTSLYPHRQPLGMTYHVGEDFYDIASGLRAVDEVIKFLHFRANDRLGHGLVLGTDARTYYSKRDFEVRGPKIELLDNAVWLYHQGRRLSGSDSICCYLYDCARKLYQEVYGSDDFNIHHYCDAWLLRGDLPEVYLNLRDSNQFLIDSWHRYDLNDDSHAIESRKNKHACNLYVRYHYDQRVRKIGERPEHIIIPGYYREAFISLIEQIQQCMLVKIERLHIAIECNPSSNYKIGEMERYDEHPILKFYNFGITTPFPHHEISVSINTDDSGVFSTSIDREYALMALALEKRQDNNFCNTPRSIVEWLNRIRKMSVEQRFCIVRLKNHETKDL